MENNYYKYYELLFSLRKEYLKNKKLLDILKSCIFIDSNIAYESKMEFKFGDEQLLPCIVLSINKKQKDIQSRMDYIKDKLLLKDNSVATSYKLGKNDNEFVLTDLGTNSFEIEIDNQKLFDSVHEKIVNSELYNLLQTTIRLNEFQIFNLDSDCFSLWSLFDFDTNNLMSINYKINDDLVNVNMPKVYSNYFIKKLLETKIHKYEIPESYIKIIEQNKVDYPLEISGNITNRNFDLEFDKPYTFVLKK